MCAAHELTERVFLIMDSTETTINRYKILPLLPVRGISVFPGMLLSFDIERSISLQALNAAMETDQTAFLLAQKDAAVEQPEEADLYKIGTVCRIRQVLRLPDGEGGAKVLVEGVSRAFLQRMMTRRGYLSAQVEMIEEMEDKRSAVKAEALIRQCYGLFGEYAEKTGGDGKEVFKAILDRDDAGYIADYIAQNIYLRHSQKQMVLEELRPVRRIALVNRILRRELDILNIEHDIHASTAEHIARQQRDMFLREQLKAIQAELGEGAEDLDEGDEYRQAVEQADLPDEVREKLLKELGRMAKQPFGSAETAVLRNYLDVCLELPWRVETEETLDVAKAKAVLDADHFGLDRVKERIAEYLAVRKLAPENKGGILCLVGPPGTGKTSIAISIARALNRKMSRISLGGVHDEAEIRGHRKTYVGAMPGRIINGILQAKSRNPVMVLDEIDKLGSDYRGDPSAALLEALDPEQNREFRDHFLELPFDLSDVFFITTANTTQTIPPALLDRMELIELTGYTDEEKLRIAKDHLLPKQRRLHGLNGNQLRVSDAAMREVIARYTREAGVRILERQVAALCRKTAAAMVDGAKGKHVRAGALEELLGPAKFKDSSRSSGTECGLVHGLAWTQAGGEMLDAEVGVMDGTGKLEITGNLGDVMKESCRAAISYIRSHAGELGIDPDFYKNKDIHIHFPEGAIPKDGPSAGVTICTAVVSALSGRAVRQDVAMTGEITLRGRVLPIGGLREKTMAALRAGIHTVIIPAENEADLARIDQTVRAALNFICAERVETVLEAAIVKEEL